MFRHSKQGTVHIVAGTLPLNHDTLGDAAAAFEPCFSGGQPRVVVHLEDVPMIDSAGLELLLDMRDRCVKRGGAMQLAMPNALCRDILQATDLTNHFVLFDDLTAAVGSFSQ